MFLFFTDPKLDQAQLKAQEEERQKREAEEKEAQLKKKREEKRLQKMVRTVWPITCLLKPTVCNTVALCTFSIPQLPSRTYFSHLHPFSTP